MPLADAASYPIWLNGLIFAVAALVIWFSGGRLTRNLDAIALRTRMDHAFVGMLFLGGITSLPELANTVTSASIGNPALAINNLLGSAAINLLLLAIVDGFVGRRAVTSIVAQPSTMMMAALCMIALVMVAAAITIGDAAVGPVGVGSATIGIACIASLWLVSGYDKRSRWAIEGNGAEGSAGHATPDDASGATLGALWLRVALDGALLLAAGYTLSEIGDAASEQIGLSSAIVGFALIGTATSLPELVTIVAALKLGRPEMAFGQVLGTNFINLSFLPIGDLAFSGGPVLDTVGRFEILLALLGAVLIGMFMVGLLEHRDRTIFRMGWDSAAVIAVFAIGVAILWTV